MSDEIHTYAELRKQIREGLRRQHPEWIDANGKSPLCDSYEARFAKLLAIFTPHELKDRYENLDFRLSLIDYFRSLFAIQRSNEDSNSRTRRIPTSTTSAPF